MTTKIGSRTPGERFALPVLNTWTVFHQYADSHSVVAAGLSERDARQLVFGTKAMATLNELWRLWNDKEWCQFKADYLRGHLSYHGMLGAKESPIRAALADLEVPT